MSFRSNVFLTVFVRSSARQVAILKLTQSCIQLKDIYATGLLIRWVGANMKTEI